MWTKKSYDAVFNWIDDSQRARIKNILLNDNLQDVVEKLEKAENLGMWSQITQEAADAVGRKTTREVADKAEKELNQLCKTHARHY